MAKSKKFKLKKPEKTYSPIIAIMGGKHHTDYMPAHGSTIAEMPIENSKPKTTISRKRIIRGIFTKK